MVDPEKIIDKINLDTWFKVLTVASGLILGFSLFLKTQWLSNDTVILFSLGIFLFSLGEWKQFKKFNIPQNIGTGILSVKFEKRKMDYWDTGCKFCAYCFYFYCKK